MLTKLLCSKDDWKNLESPYGSIFLSIPTVLDSSLAPDGRHILHVFTTSSIEDWEVNLFNLYASLSKLLYFPFDDHEMLHPVRGSPEKITRQRKRL